MIDARNTGAYFIKVEGGAYTAVGQTAVPFSSPVQLKAVEPEGPPMPTPPAENTPNLVTAPAEEDPNPTQEEMGAPPSFT